MKTKTNLPPAVVVTGDFVRPGVTEVGAVCLRGVLVPLDSDVGEAFVVDCSRNLEGVMPDAEIMAKYELSNEEWEQLANNAPLLQAVRAERERRIFNGDASREAAQRHFAKAPNILNRILTDEQIAPRHRIEAARELRQVATNGPGIGPAPGEKFIITIDLGGDEKLVYEKTLAPLDPALIDEGEAE